MLAQGFKKNTLRAFFDILVTDIVLEPTGEAKYSISAEPLCYPLQARALISEMLNDVNSKYGVEQAMMDLACINITNLEAHAPEHLLLRSKCSCIVDRSSGGVECNYLHRQLHGKTGR